jgi:hypothetical protein
MMQRFTAGRYTQSLCYFLTVIAFALATPVRAQERYELRGAVVDIATRRPLRQANVSVHYVGDTLGVTMMTNSTGGFRITSGISRPFVIVARRIGYAPDSVNVLEPARSDSVTIQLSAAATLDKVVVNVSPMQRQLAGNGFYDRKRVATGVFLDSATLRTKSTASTMPELLRPYLHPCTRIFVDGVAVLWLRDVDPATVLGVEIYASNTEAPPRFYDKGEGAARCGSIVVWRQM